MAYRQLYIKEAKKLSSRNNSISIQKPDDSVITFPLEDIDIILIEDPNCVITSRLLTDMGKFGVSAYMCGPDYKPLTAVLPFNCHYQVSKLLKLQIALLPSKKNQLWAQIIRRKIANQIGVLQLADPTSKAIAEMKNDMDNVKSGDPTNMEAVAARRYFKALFGYDFERFSGTPISSAINYGYSIIASALIRSFANAGLNLNLGIWHDAEENAFNLAYDFIEPFRQVVDRYVFDNLSMMALPLPQELRMGMVNLLNEYVYIDKKRQNLRNAIQITVSSYVGFLSSQDVKNIILPEYPVSKAY